MATAAFDPIVYWVIFILSILLITIVAFTTGLVARFKPCCITRTIKDPETDIDLINKSIQTDFEDEHLKKDLRNTNSDDDDADDDDVVIVTKHSNNTFTVGDNRRKSSIFISNDGRMSVIPQITTNNGQPALLPYQMSPTTPSLIMPQVIPQPPRSSISIYNPQQGFINPYPIY